MSTKSFVESTAEAVADRTASAGQRVGRIAGWSLVATTVVHALTTYREFTVVLALRALSRAFTTEGQAPGYFATIFAFAAQTYDTTWSHLLGIGA